MARSTRAVLNLFGTPRGRPTVFGFPLGIVYTL
jgi:hypothetical protein